jgi:hypothetical protein
LEWECLLCVIIFWKYIIFKISQGCTAKSLPWRFRTDFEECWNCGTLGVELNAFSIMIWPLGSKERMLWFEYEIAP